MLAFSSKIYLWLFLLNGLKWIIKYMNCNIDSFKKCLYLKIKISILNNILWNISDDKTWLRCSLITHSQHEALFWFIDDVSVLTSEEWKKSTLNSAGDLGLDYLLSYKAVMKAVVMKAYCWYSKIILMLTDRITRSGIRTRPTWTSTKWPEICTY